jgi:hypothetical protein
MDANVEHACSTLASEWMGVIAEAKLQLPCSEAVASSVSCSQLGWQAGNQLEAPPRGQPKHFTLANSFNELD